MGQNAKADATRSFAWGNTNCDLTSSECNNTAIGVFAIYGGLCVSDDDGVCPDVGDGSVRLEPMDCTQDSIVCDSTTEGVMYYDSGDHSLCICNSTDWVRSDGTDTCNNACSS